MRMAERRTKPRASLEGREAVMIIYEFSCLRQSRYNVVLDVVPKLNSLLMQMRRCSSLWPLLLDQYGGQNERAVRVKIKANRGKPVNQACV